MGKKIKLAALAILVAVIAYIYPTAKQKYVKHVKPKVELAVNFGKKVANLKVLGKPVPWKFILPVAGVLLVLVYVRVSCEEFRLRNTARFYVISVEMYDEYTDGFVRLLACGLQVAFD
jgi:hypothetical protein